MKLLITFLLIVGPCIGSAATLQDQKLFNTVFIENGTFPIVHPEFKDFTLGKLLATSLYPDSHLEAPTFNCKTASQVTACDVHWLSGRYKALTEAEARGLAPAVKSTGAPFVQTNDCGRAMSIKLSKGKVVAAKMTLEMCGGYSDI